MKKIVLVISILFLTGCTVEYNLHFSSDSIKEQITIIPETNQEQENTKTLEKTEYFAIIDKNRNLPYEVKQNKIGNYTSYTYTYDYGFSEFKQSSFTRCYDAYTILEENNIISLNTSKKFNCMVYNYNKIDNIKINITTDYKVIESNADEINGNVYTWNINNSNYENKSIKFSYNIKQKRIITLKEFLEQNKLSITIIGVSLILLVLVTISIYIKHKRVNKI